MRLFCTSFLLSLRHSSRRLLCLAALAAAAAALVGAAAAMPAGDPPPALRLAVVTQELSPAARLAILALLRNQGGEQISCDLLEPGDPTDGYTAVAVLPEGFYESLMDGTNRSPTLRINVSSPLEAMAARQLAAAAAQALSAAQRGLAGARAQQLAANDPSPQLLMDCNLHLIDAFLGRKKLLHAETLTVTGALPLPTYYAVSAAMLLLLSYAFLWQPVAAMLRDFSRRASRRGVVFLALFCSLLVLSAGALLPCALVLGAPRPLQSSAFWLLALLLTCWSMALDCIFSSAAGCAAVSIGGCAAMALVGGGFVPAALMPPALLAVGAPLPFSRGLSL
ncbi:MAG: hypothetical protein RR320_06195, partial [Oscillospiraceae bacterium]